MPQIEIRPARPTDAANIVKFVRELAIYERQPLELFKLSEGDVLRDGFPPVSRFETLIAELDGSPVGLALFFPNYSTWEAKPGIWVEDLFVEERARRMGIGRLLLAAVAQIALDRGCARLGLSVLSWNPAREFYRRLGFGPMGESIPLTINRESIAALAVVKA